MARRGPEQRGRKRYTVSNVEVEYTEKNLFSFFKRGRRERQPLVDISSDGLQFLCTERLKQGKSLVMTIQLSGESGPAEVRGKVRWVQQIPGKELYRTGLEIVEMSDEAFDALEKFEAELGELSIRVLCNACGAPFRVKRRLEGKKVRCPKCAQVIRIEDERPTDDVAEKSVHTSAPTSGREATALRSTVSNSLYMFLKRNVRSRLHLALIEHLSKTSGGTNVFTVSDLAATLEQPERAINDICRDLAAMGILREVGKRMYNFGPGKSTRESINELRRSSMKQKVRSAILSFVLEQEKK